MSLGILNNVSAIYAENNLNSTQSSLQKVLQQLSSGARINSGADDAAGLAIADGLKANEAALTQSQQNANNGIGLLQTADGALSQINGLLDRAVTLATEAANGGLTTNEISSANTEYQSIIGEIGSIGSTTNFNGVSVFGTSTTAFYVGDGTATGSNFYADTVGALTTSSVGLSVSTTPTPNAAITTAASETNTITVSHATDTVSGTISFHDSATLTPTPDFSLTVAAGTTLSQLASQLSAAGLTASVGTGANANVLTYTAAGTTGTLGAIFTGSLADTQGTVAYNTGTSTNSAATAGATANFVFSPLQSATDTLVGTLKVGVGDTTNGVTKSLSIQFSPGTKLADAINQINGNQSFLAAGVVASASGGGLKLTGPAEVGGVVLNTINVTGSSLSDTPPVVAPAAGTSFVGSVLTTANAQAVLTTVNSAIQNVAYQRGIVGAYTNILTAASNTAASENVNLTSAESSIRSTNYGQATSDLAKYEVLSQTGISALAQANTVQQEILKLLQ